MTSVQVAKTIMKFREIAPTAPKIGSIGELQEIFRHPVFLEGSEVERRAIMLESARSKYQSELAYPWDHYFGQSLEPFLRNKVALDLGCFTGGRSAAWYERYHLSYLNGIDVEQDFINAATQFAALKGLRARYHVAQGEALPFGDGELDAILSFDVFEHVRDVGRTLEECHRVLKIGGRLFVVFPSYFHPLEHHLALVTRLPGIHYFFSGRTLVRAYYEILEERGDAARWYRRRSPQLEPWERGNTINGTTFTQFKELVRRGGWKVVLQAKRPIGAIGRNVSKSRAAALLSGPFALGARLPGFREVCLHRITYILERSDA